jgi:hypothetical protein
MSALRRRNGEKSPAKEEEENQSVENEKCETIPKIDTTTRLVVFLSFFIHCLIEKFDKLFAKTLIFNQSFRRRILILLLFIFLAFCIQWTVRTGTRYLLYEHNRCNMTVMWFWPMFIVCCCCVIYFVNFNFILHL